MKKLGAELKRHALTAISYMLPLVVASGLLIAIGNLMGGENVTELSKMTIPSAMTTLGVLGMGLLPSFISGYIAYSIADTWYCTWFLNGSDRIVLRSWILRWNGWWLFSRLYRIIH